MYIVLWHSSYDTSNLNFFFFVFVMHLLWQFNADIGSAYIFMGRGEKKTYICD